MQLSESQKSLFLEKDIQKEYNTNMNSVLNEFNGVIKEFLSQFGVPHKDININILSIKSPLNGKLVMDKNEIIMYQKNLTNNFKYLHMLIHEATHILQYFIIENGISRKNIDKLTFEKFQKISQKFYRSNDIVVSMDMYKKFKLFIKSEPFIENDRLNFLTQDMLKYSSVGFCYYNNIGEIMANNFAMKEFANIIKDIPLSPEQCIQVKECCDNDRKSIDNIKPKYKSLSIFLQNILAIPHNHIKCLIALTKMHLPIVVKNPQNMLSELQISVENDVENIKEYIIPSEQKQKETNITKILELQMDDKENITSEIADYVLSDDITYECYQDVDQNINKDKDNDNKEEMIL